MVHIMLYWGRYWPPNVIGKTFFEVFMLSIIVAEKSVILVGRFIIGRNDKGKHGVNQIGRILMFVIFQQIHIIWEPQQYVHRYS